MMHNFGVQNQTGAGTECADWTGLVTGTFCLSPRRQCVNHICNSKLVWEPTSKMQMGLHSKVVNGKA
eukprot:1156616-Pelagomonas_calceolata.AAC.5